MGITLPLTKHLCCRIQLKAMTPYPTEKRPFSEGKFSWFVFGEETRPSWILMHTWTSTPGFLLLKWAMCSVWGSQLWEIVKEAATPLPVLRTLCTFFIGLKWSWYFCDAIQPTGHLNFFQQFSFWHFISGTAKNRSVPGNNIACGTLNIPTNPFRLARSDRNAPAPSKADNWQQRMKRHQSLVRWHFLEASTASNLWKLPRIPKVKLHNYSNIEKKPINIFVMSML